MDSGIQSKLNNHEIGKKDLFALFFIIVSFILFVISINSIYFSNNKISNIVSTEDKKIFYPGIEECVQGFVIPYDTFGFYVDMYSEVETESSVKISLLDSSYNVLTDWNVDGTSVLNDNRVYLPLNQTRLEVGKGYYLYAAAEKDCPIGIVCYGQSNNGYLSTDNNGYIWAYGLEYRVFSSLIVIAEIIVLFIIIILYLTQRINIPKWKVFSVIYCLITVAFLLVTPFNTAFDEMGHFSRAYEISKGYLLSYHLDNGAGASVIPEESLSIIQNSVIENDNFDYKNDYNSKNIILSGNKMLFLNQNQALYSPVSYIPQAIGLLLSDLLSDSLYWLYLGGRIAATFINLVFVLLSVYLARDNIKIIMLIVCTPVFLTSMISYSADGTINSFSLFFIVYIMYCRQKDSIGLRDKIVIFIGSIVVALSKVIYFPFAFIVWLSPNKTKSKKLVVYKLAVSIFAIISFIVWFVIAKSYLITYNNTDPNNQMKYVLTHIGSFAIISIKTIITNALVWAKSLFGSILYDSQVNLSDIIWIGFALMTLFVLVAYCHGKSRFEINNMVERYVIIGVILIITGLTFVSLYVQWTAYKNPVIEGIQGRYFIPLLYPLALILKKKDIENERHATLIICTILLLDMVAGINMYQIYA